MYLEILIQKMILIRVKRKVENFSIKLDITNTHQCSQIPVPQVTKNFGDAKNW